MIPVESAHGTSCPNCGAAQTGAYCTACGQRNDRLRLTARALVKDLSQTVLKVDRKVASTVKALLVPGQLTIDYLEGRRARHAKPFSLYLLCAGLHYLAWSSASASGAHEQFQVGLAPVKLQVGASDAGVKQDPEAQRFSERLNRHPERATQVMETLQSPKGQLSWVAVMVLGLWIATRKRRFLMSEHLVFTLHVQAFGSLLSAIFTPLHVPSEWPVAASFIYDAIAFARVYGFGWWGSIWRFLVTMGIALVALSLVMGVVIIGYLWW